MKLSPLMLFLILLIVLVISVVFGNAMKLEGFVSFGNSVNSMDRMNIPFYNQTKQVYKIYDNIFFDNGNGNLIEVESTSYNGNTDLTGYSISKVYVTPRDGQSTTIYNISGNTSLGMNTDKSMIRSMNSSFSSWVYPSQSVNTGKNTLLYFPWGSTTFMHVINNDAKVNVGTYLFGEGNTMEQHIYTNSPISLTSAINDTNTNNKFEKDNFYDMNKNLYKISDFVKFDTTNANLIVQQQDGSRMIYDRYSNPTSVGTPNSVTNTSTSISNTTYNSWIVNDLAGQHIVLYISIALKTLVAVIQYDNVSHSYKLINVCRFNQDGLDNPNVVPPASTSSTTIITAPSSTPSTSTSDDSGTGSIPKSAFSEYFKWYWFFKTNQNKNTEISEDYILKSQIVPPVCPSCPACPNCPSGVCTNCGGQGGSGTLSTSGSTVVSPSTNIPGAVASLGTTAGNVAGKAIDVTGKAVGGATNLGEEAVKGTVGLAKETVGGAVGLAKETVGGAVGLAKEAGSGIKDILTPHPMDVRRSKSPTRSIQTNNGQYTGSQYNSQVSKYGTPTSGVDNYSYYGALPEKSSSFIPITADFSAFGK